ncbi:hypothetical protein [Achromobacter xylosoxidans]|uniref:hypothetical protein n=1 Tax=Alcaligenes xylosoxydans xylosoxydans TaxID=85698 RepID=UPI0006C4D945|nr:hypothetical protein [Achromobacter xylosoxidans]CUI41993.1 Uncharacterised protein [Achromobacter xylosoxidans]
MSKTHWKLLINPDYIGAYALEEGQDLTVTIDYVQQESVTGTGGKKEDCTVAHLVGQKPMILNVTNSKMIAKLYGPYIEDWAGKPITLYASTTKLAGETVECLRIRPKVTVKQPPKISADRFSKAIQSIKDGAYTTDKLRANFTLTPEQESELVEALSEAIV